MQCNLRLTVEDEEYLASCARIRHISYTRLIERLVKAVCNDHLVLAVLDDDSRPIIDDDKRSFYRRYYRKCEKEDRYSNYGVRAEIIFGNGTNMRGD